MNKDINTICKECNKRLTKYNEELCVLLPCEHLIHKRCRKRRIIFKCKICNEKVKKIKTYNQVKKLSRYNKQFYQIYVDMTSLEYLQGQGEISNIIFLSRFQDIIENFTNFYASTCEEDIINSSINFMEILGFNIKIFGEQNIYNNKKIVISNHSNHLDPLILVKVLCCRFLTSSAMTKVGIFNQLTKYYPTLVFKRGEKNNTVDKIKKFVEKNDNICIFPEGFVSSQRTLNKFRTGAFNIGYPVQPVVIKYKPNIIEEDFFSYISKLCSQDKIDITIKILPVEYPPFDNNKIELIRHKMGYIGNMALSRVSNRDIKD